MEVGARARIVVVQDNLEDRSTANCSAPRRSGVAMSIRTFVTRSFFHVCRRVENWRDLPECGP